MMTILKVGHAVGGRIEQEVAADSQAPPKEKDALNSDRGSWAC